MTNTSNIRPDCDNTSSTLLTVEQAVERIAGGIDAVTGTEQLPLRSALGRILAEEVCSPLDVPPYDNSGMDGYAVRAEDLGTDGETTLTVIGTSLAGHPFHGTVGKGQAVRIMTGAKMAAGADTVIMQEHVTRDRDFIKLGGGHKRGANVRRAGEDMARGQVVLHPGKRINPADLGLLASLGVAELRVTRHLRVAFFSTGDELRSLGQSLEEGQIYDSNRYTIYGMLARLGVEIIDMGVIPDQRDAIAQAFTQAAATADVLITSGGVSVGDADYVKETLDRLGQIDFWKIAMKPGKPLAFGKLGTTVFFGLPGNPVSSMVTFYQIVQPSLRRMSGESDIKALRLQVPCMSALKKTPGRADYQRGILHRDDSGQLVVSSTGMQGSHVLSSMSQANCFIILPAEWGKVEAGTTVEVEPFAGLI